MGRRQQTGKGTIRALRRIGGALMSVLLLASCSTVPNTLDAPDIPDGSNVSVQEHAQMLRAFGGEYRSPAVRAMLERIVGRIIPATDRPGEGYRVTILKSPQINAFALPSHQLYVTRGLLALANDSSEVAAVIAHEIAHVTLRHAAARTELEARSALVSRVVSDVLQDKSGSSLYADQSRFSIARFSREQEFEADKTGIATLAKAGYDPFGAPRFLKSLDRTSGGRQSGTDMLSTHPSLKERIKLTLAAARVIGAPGLGRQDRNEYLATLDGMEYGDSPDEGLVVGRRFIHTTLRFAFEAPPGFRLENTARAVLGTSDGTGMRLMLDVVRGSADLQSILDNIWNDAIKPEDFQSETVNGLAVLTARAQSPEWVFRLAAIRQSGNVFRLIVAARKQGSALDAVFRQMLNSVHTPTAEEGERVQPLKLRIVTAGTGESTASLARRMASPPGPAYFSVLNGLEQGQAPVAGQSYKIVVE
ncbi:MAG: M48 family metalloprotease [Methylobacteriaceae bacterium]|nr:M48 family metalloprotease [Methylobacteriaceae bacterium]